MKKLYSGTVNVIDFALYQNDCFSESFKTIEDATLGASRLLRVVPDGKITIDMRFIADDGNKLAFETIAEFNVGRINKLFKTNEISRV